MKLKNCIFLLVFLCSAFVGRAGVIYVTNGSDALSGSLRLAINSAVSNDTIIINFKGGIALSDTVDIIGKNNLTIIGPYPKHNSFNVEGTNTQVIFNIANCSNISIKGLGFKHSVNATFDVRALQITNSSNIEIEDCVFEGCQPTNGNGGAVSVLNNSDVEFLNCSFIENGAASQGASGGAMAFDDSGNSAFIRNCTFYKNRADSLGGAIFIDTVFNTDERFVFFNNTFLENEADNSFNESGHAIWFDVIDGLLNLATLKPIAFANNIFSKNFNAGNLNQSQIYCPTAMVGNNWSIWGGGNYYHFSAGEPIINAFNGGNDFTGPDAGVNLGLRGNPSAADIITDGYGLKYFTITSQTSPLVDNGISNPGATNGFGLFIPFSADIAGNDCRRAPREMDGNNDATSVVDIGATESTLYRISGTSVLPSAWTVLLQSVNGSGTPSEVHYVEFDLGVGVTEVQVLPNAPAILRTIYIDGFSQDGSAIPGPSNVNGLTTDTLTPARNLPILRPNGSGGDSTSGVKLSAANSIVAGISIVGFNHNGIRVNSAATGAKIFGTTIGVVSNVTPTLATSLGDGNGRTGVYATTSDATIGGIYHHQRNVITGNGYDPDPGFATYFGTNIRVGNSASNIKIVGNVIGLHPNGKDVTVKDESNAANNGIFLGTAPNAEIGNPSLFGLNIIGNHNGNGIMQIGTGGGTIIDNNHIGVTFDGLDPAANNHGVYLLNDTSITIGNRIGNVISTNDSSGIRVINGQGIKILGNIIGGDKSLTSTTFGNHRGVYITGNSGSSATPIHIGVDDFFTESERNIIVNNDIGVYLSGAGVQEVPIGGNLIGVGHYDATSALPNTVGIKIDSGAHHNYIGYEPSTAQTNQINIISGNTDVGVWFDGESTNNNRVASNIIGGTKISASLNLQALGNGTGVRFSDIESGTSNAIGNENDPDLKLIIVGNENGVEITGSSGISVLNSNIGIDTNNTVLPNNFGISILNSDIIGIGGASTKSNRISGNDSIGISIADSKDIILEGNFIGTNKEGTSAIGNEIGIKIYRGSDILIGQTEPNVISGNEIGLMMDSTFSNVIRNNYFGLSADGTFKIPGSYFGILGDDLYGSNDFGVSTLGVLGRNHFASDSIDISILDSKLQKIANNVFGYENGGINLVGSATTGIGVRIRHSKKIRVGGPGTSAGNTFGNRRVGVFLQNADSVQIQHCNFGVDITGTNVDIDNNQRFGVGSRGNSSNNFIGPKNVFGGNRIGIGLASADSGNKIFGNYFGIDTLLSASNVFQNDTAIYLLNSSNNEIGFGGDSANQIINYIDGIVLLNTADSNVFINNYIGTTSNGVVGGNTGNGVVINGSFRNKFGSNNFADRNVISRNNANGVNILNGSSGNSILRNSIHNNNALGIDIGTGFIVSDMGETGLQDEIHTPIINSAFACVSTDFNVEIEANNLTISDTYYFDIYTSNGDTLDAVSYSGYGEGGKSVFFDTVVATATSETFIFDLTGAVSAGDTIVAIITNGTTGSSSEFGQFIAVSGAPVAPDTTFLNEICETGALGGSIEIDNSANSTFVYSVSFDGSPMESTSADVFLQDTLIPGTYNMEIDYGNGCTVTFGKTLETGGVFEIGDSPLDDTCGLDVGIVILNVINNSISGAVFNDTLFSLNNGTTFQQGNTFGNLTAGSYTPQIQLDVTKGTVSDLCLASNISTINVDEHLIPVADLEFTYNNFCSDVNGSVTSTPNFSDGAYSISFTPITSTVTLDTASGQISSAQNGDTYTLTYYYGTCMSTDVAVTPFNVVYPTITMDDFCVNNNSPIPTVTPTGGTFSLVQQPMSSPEIVAANGQIQTTFSSFTPGLYHVEYITSDANCPRTDTVIIEAFDIPVAMSYTTEGNLINMDLLDIDSISFCPNFVGIDSIGSAFMTTNWIEPDGTAIINNSYSVNFPADGDDSTYTLDYFYTQDFTGTNTTVTCQSDLDSLVVQINAIPVDPQLTSDTSYCEGESLSILDVQNDALVHNLRWSNNVSSATDSVLTTSTPHLYPVPTSDISNYNNFILSVYSRDSTGVDCYSDYDTTEISFHSNPAIPALTLNVGGSTVIANQTIEICPTSDDSLVDTNVGGGNSIFAVSGNAPQTTDILQLQSSGDFSPLTTELVSYHTSEIQTLALVPTTCYSDTDTVFIQTYAIPVDPELTSDTSYCEGESLSILDVQNDALVHNLRWSNNVSSATDSVLTTSTPHLYPVPTSDISNYNNFILSVYSRDSTGVDCYSDYDTTEISFHSNPAIPALTLNVGGSTVIANQTIEICPTSDDSLVDTNVGGGNSIFAVSGNAPQTTDILQLQSSGDFSPLTTELVSYHTSEIQTLALVPTTCYSDTDTVFIQTYAIPVDPELTSDTSYCEGESLSILDVQNDALVHNLRWSNNVSSATDSVLTTSTPHLYPVPTSDISNYNNFILSVYSRDSTGVDCYSDYDTTEISFHSNPAIPALTLNVGGSTVIANQTIEICPTSDDSLVDTNVGGGNSIFAVAGNAPQTTDILQLQSSGDFSPLTTELVSYHTSEIQTLALVPTTCYSDTDTVFIQTYAIPVDPELTSDTSYCEGESLSILDVQNDALVHNLRWSNNVSSATDSVLTTSTPHLYPVPTSDISNYNNFILSVYSRDSTGVDCYSDYDTTEISFHSNPAIPALTLNVGGSTVIANQTIEICPTSDDSLVDTNVGGGNSIFAVAGNAPQTTDILQLQSSGDFSPLTTELVSYHTSEIQTLALVPTTCYSDTDTVFIQTYAIPVDPELTSDTSYCEGESLSILDVQNDALVHNLRWSNNVSSAYRFCFNHINSAPISSSNK